MREVHVRSGINNIDESGQLLQNDASKIKSGLCDGILYKEHSGTTLVATLQFSRNETICLLHHHHI